MTTIAIKDLPASVDLDRQAMRAITGGARFGGGQSFRALTAPRDGRIVNYPGGPAFGAQPPTGKPLK